MCDVHCLPVVRFDLLDTLQMPGLQIHLPQQHTIIRFMFAWKDSVKDPSIAYAAMLVLLCTSSICFTVKYNDVARYGGVGKADLPGSASMLQCYGKRRCWYLSMLPASVAQPPISLP